MLVFEERGKREYSKENLPEQGPVSRKSRKLFVKLRPAYPAKLVFSYAVKGIKIKITAKFRAFRHLRFEDTKRIMSPEMRSKSLGTFEKRAPEKGTNDELNPHMASSPGIDPAPHWWEASALTNAPSLLENYPSIAKTHSQNSIYIFITDTTL